MVVGESKQFGNDNDIQVKRGRVGRERAGDGRAREPGVVRFDPATRTLSACMRVRALGITMGHKITRVQVVVRPQGIQDGRKLIVEPGSLVLAPGQAGRLNAYIENPDGTKINVAVLKSNDPRWRTSIRSMPAGPCPETGKD